MSIRNVTLAAGVCLAASVAAFGQPGVGYLFQLPGQNSSANTPIYGYPYAANPLTPAIDTLGPNGTYQIVAKPDGSGYYVLGTALQIANQNFSNFTTINGIGGTPTAVAASPDGNYVVVGAGSVYVLGASSSTILFNTTTNGTTIVGIAISRDSKYAYILSNGPGASYVNQINLVTKANVGSPLQLTGNSTSISFSPLNFLYVTATNRIFEIDPVLLQVTAQGSMTPNGTPGPLRFTPDGTTAYCVNQTSNVSGGAIFQITLATHSVAFWPTANPSPPTPLDDVIVAGNGRVFAISYSATTLYDVVTAPLGLTVSSLNSILNAQGVQGAVVSTELPTALFLYLLVANGGQENIYRVNLSTNQVSAQASAATSGGPMEFVGVPPQPATGSVGSFLQFNNNLTVQQGTTSVPLVARVLDLTGRPIFNQPVNFTTDASNGVVINTPSPTTNADGYVQTTITAPAAQVTATITLTAGTANTTFTITVPGVGGTGGPGPNGVTQVTIVTGNGKLIETGFSSQGDGDPLTVLVTDVNGNPLPGVSVTFNVTSGTGNVVTYNNADGTPGTTTDKFGMARTDYYASTPARNADFEVETVVAVTPYGSVSFYEVEYAYLIVGTTNPAFAPTVQIQTPSFPYVVTVPEGGVAQNAVSALILANSVPQLNCPNAVQNLGCPVPDVAIRIVNDPATLAASPYASCQPSSGLSDANTGTAYCNIQSTCSGAGPGTYTVYYEVGDFRGFQGSVHITPGSAQQLAIISGNNQIGGAGGALPFPLLATVTDACGKAATGGQVSWKVTQGSATLSNVVSTSGSSGQVSAQVTFGQAAGPVQVTVTLGTASVVTFSLTNQAVVTSMTILNGNNQTTTVNSAFPQTLTVQIKDANNSPVTGVSVGFAVTAGNASINPTSATTDSQGRASTTATSGSNPGSIIIVASYGSVSATFSLTAVPQGPVVAAASFQNAASFQTGIVPCGLAIATGSGLAPGIVGTVSGASFFGPLPYTLNGLSLSVNGVPAPIYQISNTNGKQQVTFQTPCEVAPSTTGTVVIQLSGATTTVPNVVILAAQPGIFFSTGGDGNPDGYVISADDGSYVTTGNPAKRGHNYYLVATGLGQVTPATSTDSAGIAGQSVALPVIVGLSGGGVPVFSSTYQTGEIGIYAVGFTIPLTNQTGINQPLVLGVQVNGQVAFSNTVYIQVQ
jgi:uncharacterized protein (TIGR03437 family)